MVVNEIEGSQSFEEIIAGVETGDSKVAPSVPVQETRTTNVVFNRQSSTEHKENKGFEQIIAEAENNEVEDHSGTGSIVSVLGQVDGVLAEYSKDTRMSPTETIPSGIDGDIMSLVGDEAGQWPEPPPKPNYV